MFSDWLPNIFKRAFAIPPAEPIWQWAEREVVFSKKHSAEPRYRSKRTPWVRWLQEICREPWRMRKGRRVRIRRVRIKKSTQSGFTEGLLNVIRWRAKFQPANFIYAINSKEEVGNIRERLVDTLGRLGQEIFEDGTVAKDLEKYIIQLRDMTGWFLGSYSSGAFSNKYAPLVIADELDDHATIAGQAGSLDLLAERLKTADDEDLSVALSKPQLVGGPIDKEHAAGDQYEWMVPCPHCGCCQLLDWSRVRFSHCHDMLGAWDEDRVLQDTYYECLSGCRIEEGHKEWMEDHGRWWLVSFGDPETISLHLSDLHSTFSGSTWGHLALEFIKANELAKRGDFTKLQAFKNGRLGEGFEQRVERFSREDVLACRGAYRRGIVPRAGLFLVGGLDVGLYVNTRWVVLGIEPRTTESWLIDWGAAGEPLDFIHLMKSKRYECPATKQQQAIALGFIDCRYLREKVYAAALQLPNQVWPTYGHKIGLSTRSISFQSVPDYPPGFGVITYVDADAKYELFVDRIKRRRHPSIHFPEDADDDFLSEFANERMIKDPVTAKVSWAEKPAGPNHWGDATKIVLTGFDFITDGPRMRASGSTTNPSVEQSSIQEIDLSLVTSNEPPAI